MLCCESVENPLLSRGQSSRKLVPKFANMSKRYRNNLLLALAVAIYVTAFGSPVYSRWVSWTIFGEKNRYSITQEKYVSVCGDNKMGPKINIGTDDEPELINYNRTSIAARTPMYAWCGFLPASYFKAWPSVVQTAIFTIYLNTGSTVKLAWQCIAGTFSAVLNIYFLTLLFPKGAADIKYIPAIVWIDLVVVLFVYLASKADVNTMMMGMNWTVCLMLHFMDPETGSSVGSYETWIPFVNWDGETTVVMLTSIMGCILAIVATVFPMPLLNISRVHDDAKEVTDAIDNVFEEAIEYWAGNDKGPKRFSIFGKMSALSAAVKRVDGNLADSFWETFNLCSYGRIRALYHLYNSAIARNDDEIYMVKSALESLDFNTKHHDFVEVVKEPLQALKTSTIHCLRLCASCCKDGKITSEEKAEIEQTVEDIEKKQQELSNKFQLAKKKSQYVATELATDSLLVFSLSQWAREIADFGAELANFEKEWVKSGYSNPCQGLLSMAGRQLKSIFDPIEMFKEEQLRFALMNGIPIMITYVIAFKADQSVFEHFSSVMPGTLTLLVTYDYGATFFKNIQKLMGVTLGLTLPLLVMSFLQHFGCDSYWRFILHVMSLFLFNFVFTFMYYTSEQWATIGICIAGFGCYPMFHQCDDTKVKTYESQYKHIAQVIIAIMLKMWVGHLMAPAEPRDNAVDSLDKLMAGVKAAYLAFLKGEIKGSSGLKACRDNVKMSLAECEAICPKCDPSLQIVPGSRTPFKYELFGFALGQFRLVLSDLDMLVLAMTGHESVPMVEVKVMSLAEMMEGTKKEAEQQEQERELHRIFEEQPAWDMIKEDLITTIDNVLDMLHVVLTHDTEDPLDGKAVEKLRSMDRIMELAGVTEFYEQVSQKYAKTDVKDAEIFSDTRIITQLKRTRLNVAVNALSLSVKHIGQISAACFNNMIYS